jgi:hypothetical protein
METQKRKLITTIERTTETLVNKPMRKPKGKSSVFSVGFMFTLFILFGVFNLFRISWISLSVSLAKETK